MEQCTCGGYPVANCTQCKKPLCNQHAYKWYAYPTTDEYKRLATFLSKFPNHVVRGEKFNIAALVSSQLIMSYEDKHVCLNCHQENVQHDASELFKRTTIPEEEVDFMMWIIFESPFRKVISVYYHIGTPHLSDEELIRFWLRFARRAKIPLAVSSPTWEIHQYSIEPTGKVYVNGREFPLSREKIKSDYTLHSNIESEVDKLLKNMSETNMLKEEGEDNEAPGEYADKLLQQWRQQRAVEEQYYNTLTASLQQAAMNIAEVMKRTGIYQDAAVGRFFPKTVGWIVWIDSRIVHSDGGYAGTSLKFVDALILSPHGILYAEKVWSDHLHADPRTIIRESKELTEVKVTSEKEFHNLRQKLADFAGKHNLQI